MQGPSIQRLQPWENGRSMTVHPTRVRAAGLMQMTTRWEVRTWDLTAQSPQSDCFESKWVLHLKTLLLSLSLLELELELELEAKAMWK